VYAKNKIIPFLKKIILVIFMFFITFTGYVWVVTANTNNMTLRQKILKAVYPAFTWWNRITGTNSTVFINENPAPPPFSLYNLSITLNDNSQVSLAVFKGKKILLVNTASDCGYTDQYDELQKLYDEEKDRLVIIGFPSNDFKQQEKGTDEEIAAFCRINYGVRFPLVKKSSVLPGPEQHPVFQWLTDKSKNGWTSKKPSWNFSKYLVNEEGMLIGYFDPSVSPLNKKVREAILKK
jgi:glutathione peroxidase